VRGGTADEASGWLPALVTLDEELRARGVRLDRHQRWTSRIGASIHITASGSIKYRQASK
jgi:hypothetical protein